MAYLTYWFIIIFVGITIYLLRRYYQKRKIKDTHFEIMGYGSKAEKTRLGLLYLGYSIVVLALTGLLTYLTYLLRISNIDLTNAIYYDFEWSKITLLPWLFFSTVILALPLELLQFKLFPNKVPKNQQKGHLKRTYIAIVVIIFITIPSIILLFDSYTIVNQNEIIKDNFLSINEKHYSFDEIASININGYLKKITFHLDILVNLRNGNSFELFNSGSMPTNQEIEVLKILKQNNFPITITQQPSEEDFNYIASLTKTPSGKTFNGFKKSQETKIIFAEVSTIVNT